mmetsp:Transcript_15743/g.48929  ORF Transcript_15743/g.48929 Transcript_15743/m.48929 type:complete len:267 (+) Transcript_15743:1575-2375(+)
MAAQQVQHRTQPRRSLGGALGSHGAARLQQRRSGFVRVGIVAPQLSGCRRGGLPDGVRVAVHSLEQCGSLRQGGGRARQRGGKRGSCLARARPAGCEERFQSSRGGGCRAVVLTSIRAGHGSCARVSREPTAEQRPPPRCLERRPGRQRGHRHRPRRLLFVGSRVGTAGKCSEERADQVPGLDMRTCLVGACLPGPDVAPRGVNTHRGFILGRVHVLLAELRQQPRRATLLPARRAVAFLVGVCLRGDGVALRHLEHDRVSRRQYL